MELRHFQYLIAAATHRSFRRAASAIGTQQSTVSRTIRELERYLGAPLFDRSRCGVKLTDLGQQLLCRIGPAIDQLHEALAFAASVGRREQNALRVGLHLPLGSGFLADLLRCFESRHREVCLAVVDGDIAAHIAALRRGCLDVAFLAGCGECIPNCASMRLWEERMFVALPKGHALAVCDKICVDELSEQPSAATAENRASRTAARGARAQTSDANDHAIERLTALDLVALGKAIGFINEATTSMALPNVVYRPLAGAGTIVPFYAVWSPSNDKRILQHFLALARRLACAQRKPATPDLEAATFPARLLGR